MMPGSIKRKNGRICPACQDTGEKVKIKTKSNFKIFKCSKCGLEFVCPMPNSEQLRSFYQDYSNFRAAEEVLILNAKKNIDRLLKFGLTRERRLLDFGCGANIFVSLGNSKRWFGYDYYKPTEKNMINNFIDQKWDFITMWGVLEHLTDPKCQITQLAQTLNPGGIMALTTVTTESAIPFQYKPPEHVTYWTKKAIKSLFSSVGLTILEYENYKMIQRSDIYLNCVMRTVPKKFQRQISHSLPDFIEVPTNEIFVVCVKKDTGNS